MPSNMLAKLMLSNVFGNSVVGRSMIFPLPKTRCSSYPPLAVKGSQACTGQSPALARLKAPGSALTGSPTLCGAQLWLPEASPFATDLFESAARTLTLAYRHAHGTSQLSLLPSCARRAPYAQMDIWAAKEGASCFPRGRNGAP